MKQLLVLSALVGGLLFIVPQAAQAERTMYGVSGGAGFVGGLALGVIGPSTETTVAPINLRIVLPALELRFFRKYRRSLEVQLLLGNLLYGVIIGAANHGLVLPLQVGIYYSFRFGGKVRFLVAPGGQIDLRLVFVGGGHLIGLSLTPGARLGVEFAISKRFSLEVRVRPYFLFGVALGADLTPLVGGGLTGELALYFG